MATPCRCRAQIVSRAQARRLVSAVHPAALRGVSFDRTPVATMPEPRRAARSARYVRDLDANLDAGRGLWLFGEVGTGKTTLAMLVSKAALEAGRSVAIYSLPRLLTEIRDTYDEGSRQLLPSCSTGSPASTCCTSTTSAPRSRARGCSSSSTRSSTPATRTSGR